MAQARAPSGFAIYIGAIGMVAGATSAACGSSPAGPVDASAADTGSRRRRRRPRRSVLSPTECPGISSFAIDTTDLTGGEAANASVDTAGTAPSFVRWSVVPASGGVFSDAASTHTTFTCAGAGNVVVTANVGLVVEGLGNVCQGVAYTSYEASVRCEE